MNISPTAAVIFLLLVAVTLGITYWAGKRNKSVSSHLVASGHISGRQNGVAIAGDFISAATFLGTTGAIALGGVKGFYYAVYLPICYVLANLPGAQPPAKPRPFPPPDVPAPPFWRPPPPVTFVTGLVMSHPRTWAIPASRNRLPGRFSSS